MTDADDAGLVEALRLLANKGHIGTNDADMLFISARALSAQRREIDELRRERDIANEAWKGTRCAELREQARADNAEYALAEASKVAFIAGWNAVFSQHHDADTAFAASAFAAKHGGRDG